MKICFLKNTPAIKNKRVYKIPFGGDRWELPTAESHLVWLWFGALAYGADFKAEFDLINEMKSSYKLLYNYELNGSDIDEILCVPYNKISNGYEF